MNMFMEFISLSFAYNVHACQNTCNPNLVCDMHMCVCKLLCARLVRTQEHWITGLTLSILRAHACMHMCKIKNYIKPMPHMYSVKFKLNCAICTYNTCTLFQKPVKG